MPNYRRNYALGGTYFFTLVTAGRRPLFLDPIARRYLRASFASTKAHFPFTVVALVLLPEHLHAIWQLPPGDHDFSLRWSRIKSRFTRRFLGRLNGVDLPIRRPTRRERAVWQPRFWEHTCRDEADLKRCVDYVHWNPVKHGHVDRVADYPYSTFHRFVRLGEYASSWGTADPCPEFDTLEI